MRSSPPLPPLPQVPGGAVLCWLLCVQHATGILKHRQSPLNTGGTDPDNPPFEPPPPPEAEADADAKEAVAWQELDDPALVVRLVVFALVLYTIMWMWKKDQQEGRRYSPKFVAVVAFSVWLFCHFFLGGVISGP